MARFGAGGPGRLPIESIARQLSRSGRLNLKFYAQLKSWEREHLISAARGLRTVGEEIGKEWEQTFLEGRIKPAISPITEKMRRINLLGGKHALVDSGEMALQGIGDTGKKSFIVQMVNASGKRLSRGMKVIIQPSKARHSSGFKINELMFMHQMGFFNERTQTQVPPRDSIGPTLRAIRRKGLVATAMGKAFKTGSIKF